MLDLQNGAGVRRAMRWVHGLGLASDEIRDARLQGVLYLPLGQIPCRTNKGDL